MKVGDNVAWESQSGGSWTKKKGTIVAIVQAGNSAQKLVPMTARKSHIKFDADISRTDRILVAVPAGKNKQIMHYYCPTKRTIELQEIELKRR